MDPGTLANISSMSASVLIVLQKWKKKKRKYSIPAHENSTEGSGVFVTLLSSNIRFFFSEKWWLHKYYSAFPSIW